MTDTWDKRRFAGKTAIITGAASGIGAATARRLASEGAALGLCDIQEQALDALAEEIAATTSGKPFVRLVDVSIGEAIEAFVRDTASALGQLDIMVNNAGIGCFGHVDEISPAQWRQTMAIDLDSVFFGSRAALPFLRQTAGCIVNTASVSGLAGDHGLAAYTAAKAAVINLTRTMALDHGPEGIRINCVCPGGTDTAMMRAHSRDAEIMRETAAAVPMRRLGTPDEIAGGIAFLASSDASYVTGHTLVIDGGVTAQTGQPDFDRLYRERGWDKKMLQRL